MSRICAFSSICAEDACWLLQYFAEAERLSLPFVMHLDRCPADVKSLVRGHPLCVAHTSQDDLSLEFDETHKQQPFDALVGLRRFDWAMAWDVDETYERAAPEKLRRIADMAVDYVDVRWVNLWGDPQHIRVDGPFSGGHRVKFYNLQSGRCWRFNHKVINGPKLCDSKGNPLKYDPHRQNEAAVRGQDDLVCIHWGMMTRALREQHKARWDRIYTTAVGAQPYKFWDFSLDEEHYPPVVREHDYLP